MNLNWNKIIYKCWSPIYDSIFNRGVFVNARKQLFQAVDKDAIKSILFVGVGTGSDLEYIDSDNFIITGIDYSDAMLAKAKHKFTNSQIQFLEMDAQKLDFENNSFDLVVGSLILSVVPNPNDCFNEMVRVVKPNGQIIIFDKFIGEDRHLSIIQKLIKPLISLLGTDISLRFEHLYTPFQHRVRIKVDEPILFKGMYRKIILIKD